MARIAADSVLSALAPLVGEGEYRVGFTGSRREMTGAQQKSLGEVLRALPAIVEAHHGDCVGADAAFHSLCAALQIPIHIHPPSDASNRAHCQGAASIAKEKDFLVRNHDIIQASDVLLAAPRAEKEVLRSGIWATIRYARKSAKVVLLILPDGVVVVEGK